ncbi:hypothetical protein DL98DRAFT_657935 [Cadophora sp. DSE1049]|nr:hypothetical protein DL98DRAFT_657935 [Cadophora sp. DSE1049]
MQFSKLSTLATFSFLAVVHAAPFEARQIPACYKDAETAQATCINDVPTVADGRKDRTAVAACFTTATTAFKACSSSTIPTTTPTKRQTTPSQSQPEMETCISQVNDVNMACIEAIPSDENGLKDLEAVRVW